MRRSHHGTREAWARVALTEICIHVDDAPNSLTMSMSMFNDAIKIIILASPEYDKSYL